MPNISSNQNLDAHYSTNPKVERPKKFAVSAPINMPTTHVFGDKDAKKKFHEINQDIFEETQKEKSRESNNFIKVFGGIVALILGAKLIQHFFKKS
jgi:hypothetical protein